MVRDRCRLTIAMIAHYGGGFQVAAATRGRAPLDNSSARLAIGEDSWEDCPDLPKADSYNSAKTMYYYYFVFFLSFLA